ncbi:MAG TPA: hypothetical protein VFT44_01855 [Pyrinomonadaceae bacterium]|nr:hypothetical protein [Pyrinomonadaceae bacterium]
MKHPLLKAKLITIVVMCSLICACTSIPDIQPYADATANLATALNKGFAHTENQLSVLQAENPDLELQAQTTLIELRKRWKPSKEAINALVAYTDSLAALANAGKTGKEAANRLTSSFEGLYNAVAQLVPIPGLPAGVQTAFNAIGAINGVIARMRAKRALKEAAEEAAPAVKTIADVLAANFQELANLSAAAGNAAAAGYRNKHHGVLDYHQTLVDNETTITSILSRMNRYYGLPAEVRAKAERVRQANNNGTGAAEARVILEKLPAAMNGVFFQIVALDPGLPNEIPADQTVKALEARQKELLAKSKVNRDELSRINPEYQAVTAKLVAIDDATRSGTQLFGKGQEAIRAWAKSHEDLKLALEKKQGLTFRELVSIVQEIVDAFSKEKTNG